MKIIIHTQYYPPEAGAPQARLSELAERLVLNGFEVTVLTSMPNYPIGRIYAGYRGMFHREKRKGVNVIRTWIYPTNSMRFVLRLSNYFSFVISSLIVGFFTLPKADILLTESPPLFLGISGFILSRIKRARWIFNVSDLWPESAVRLGVIGDGVPLKISEYLETFCYKKAWLVSGQSKEILKGVKQRCPDVHTYFLSNGVDSSKFSPEFRSESLKQNIGDGADCVAVYAGLHGIAQGLDQIIDAAKVLEDLNGKLKIVFVGDGVEKPTLMQKAKGLQIVKFLDPKPPDDIPVLLASSDIAIVPLKNYIPGAVPSKIYEAMASGVPIILVAEGEAAFILENSNAGIALRPGNVSDIAQTLRNLLMDNNLRLNLGKNGRKAVLDNFNRDLIVSKFIKFLRDKI